MEACLLYTTVALVPIPPEVEKTWSENEAYYISVCVCVHVFLHGFVCTCVFLIGCMCLCVSVCVCVWVRVCVFVHVCLHAVRACVRVSVGVCVCV